MTDQADPLRPPLRPDPLRPVGETLKYRAGYGYLRKDAILDNRTVIKIENEIRQFHGMSPRTGADHGTPVITVQGKVQ